MSKRQIIDAIMKINRTARAEFLARFSERELRDYLEHLEAVYGPASSQRSRMVMVA